MKKIFIMAVALAGFIAEAQEVPRGRVGINTVTPRATLEISRVEPDMLDKGQPQGVIFPHFTTAERDAFTNITSGTLIFNTSKQCVEIYQNGQWTCIDENTGATANNDLAITNFKFTNVDPIVGYMFYPEFSMDFTNNIFQPITVEFPVETIKADFDKGVSTINLGYYSTSRNPANKLYSRVFTLPSLAAGATTTIKTYLYGSHSLNNNNNYNYSMTFTQPGVLKAKFNHLGIEAETEIKIGTGAATIQDYEYMIPSAQRPRLRSYIDNAGNKINIKIPYKAGRGVYSDIAVTQNSAPGQGDEVLPLTLKIDAGQFSSHSSAIDGFIDAYIEVGDTEEYEVKLLQPGEMYTIATFDVDMGLTEDKKYKVVLNAYGAVPDRCYNKTTKECVGYGAETREHQFVYFPIKGPDGRIWLNYNLGADYAKVGGPDFKISYYNTPEKNDPKAYGSLFQWQRKADGHELINWSSATSGSVKYTSTNSTRSKVWDKPDTNQFIKPNASYYSWVENELLLVRPHNLWQASGDNNPCPEGYHVPTNDEWDALEAAIGPKKTGTEMYNETQINLPLAGYINYDTRFQAVGVSGNYSSSSMINGNYNNRYFAVHSTNFYSSYQSTGVALSIRCIKDL